MEPLRIGDIVRKVGPDGSHTSGQIVRFTMQGDVAVAWVQWDDQTATPNPSAELRENLRRVGESE